MARLTMAAAAWTIDEASAEFARTGIPMQPAQLRAIVRALHWKPAGETASGEHGGRGHALYPIADLQRLHAALSPWLQIESGHGRAEIHRD